jgi:hypothetical protein
MKQKMPIRVIPNDAYQKQNRAKLDRVDWYATFDTLRFPTNMPSHDNRIYPYFSCGRVWRTSFVRLWSFSTCTIWPWDWHVHREAARLISMALVDITFCSTFCSSELRACLDCLFITRSLDRVCHRRSECQSTNTTRLDSNRLDYI